MERLEQFLGKGWTRQLEGFFNSPEFEKIGDFVKKEKAIRSIAPDNKDIFRAFLECPWEKLHTVIMGDLPYTDRIMGGGYIADGLAFSARKAVLTPRPLFKIFTAINSEVYKDEGYHIGNDNDLQYLANQGVLLLNCSLTVSSGDRSSDGEHRRVWKPFIEYVLKTINDHKDSIGFLILGTYPGDLAPLLTNQTFAVYTFESPQEALQRGGRWDTHNSFGAITSWHKTFNNIKIVW